MTRQSESTLRRVSWGWRLGWRPGKLVTWLVNEKRGVEARRVRPSEYPRLKDLVNLVNLVDLVELNCEACLLVGMQWV